MTWSIQVGEELPRRELHVRHGGSRQSGMTRTRSTDNLLLFSSTAGLRYGYTFDGWKSDGTYHYTGEGQVGDQVFTRGNAALRDHEAKGLRPRLFEQVRRSIVRYVGEFRLAPDHSYYEEEAPDREGDYRKVIVFRLVPIAGDHRQPDSGTQRVSVRDVPVEAYLAETFQSEPRREPTVAERREAALVQRYVEWLRAARSSATRKEIAHPSIGRALYTDLYDVGRSELVEAKSSASRHHVRLAIGQILDYARYVGHESRAVLLPSDPGSDLTDLLHRAGIVCVYEHEHGSFRRCEPQAPSVSTTGYLSPR